MTVFDEVSKDARARAAGQAKVILQSLNFIRQGRPYAAEPCTERLVNRIMTKFKFDRSYAREYAGVLTGAGTGAAAENGAENIRGASDFLSVNFFACGYRASRAVARIATAGGSHPLGTGFMVSPNLLLTNHHVLPDEAAMRGAVVEFNYELDENGQPLQVSRFRLDPDTFVMQSQKTDLDYTLIAVGSPISTAEPLSAFGWCRLSSVTEKHALGEIAHIIQHPNGQLKQIVVRDNRLVSRLDTVLHYTTDTDEGSSGSPVFNDAFEVIGMHHWGAPFKQTIGDDGLGLPTSVNEAIRISAIIGSLNAASEGLSQAMGKMLDAVLSRNGPESMRASIARSQPNDLETIRLSVNQSEKSLSIPIELSITVSQANSIARQGKKRMPVKSKKTLEKNGKSMRGRASVGARLDTSKIGR